MALKDLYENWTFKPIAGTQQAIQTPKDQADGTVKIVTQSVKQTYDSWNFSALPGLPSIATPPIQAAAEYAVNFLRDEYQPLDQNKINRTPGDTTVVQSADSTKTFGQFKPSAFNYGNTLYNNTSLRGRQRYNSSKPYIGTVEDTPGALFNSNPASSQLGPEFISLNS